MTSTGILTLTTDFGVGDGYVATMKGVALGIAAGLTIVDITHEVPPHDIRHGAFVLGSVYRSFPDSAVHVGVVDPGVGTARRPILLVTPYGAFVAPDNGLLTYVAFSNDDASSFNAPDVPFGAPFELDLPAGCRAYVLTNPAYQRHPVSNTFHGRDVFTPAAAYYALGASPEDMGTPTDRITALNLHRVVACPESVEGAVVHVDRFGNLITNIRAEHLSGHADNLMVEIAGRRIEGLSRTFADRAGLSALIGSLGYLEVVVRDASAARELGVGTGAGVRVCG